MKEQHWKFFVSGVFLQEGRPCWPCEAIIETGDRQEGSPFRFKGVGPISQSDEKGSFSSFFITYGTEGKIVPPETIKAYIRTDIRTWEPVTVAVPSDSCSWVSACEMNLDRLKVNIPKSVIANKGA